MENQESKVGLNDAVAEISTAINKALVGGTPIPFIVATIELIKHDLCNQHIAMTKQIREIAKGNVPPPTMPTEN